MSTRAVRKLQREKEEQERLRQLEEEAQELEDDEGNERPAPIAAKKSAFAMLEDDGDEDDEDAENNSDEEDTAKPAVETTSIPQAPSKKKRKKKKKSKAAAAAVDPEEKDELDEIDAALKQLAMNNANQGPAADQTAAATAGQDTTQHKLFAIDTQHLHAENEMRRLFGRAALEREGDDDGAAAAAGGNRRQQRRGQQVGLAQALRGQQRQDGGRGGSLSAIALKRNIFIQGKEDWPVAPSGGLGMEVESKEADGTVLFRYVHNSRYQDVQGQFATCVASMDPNRMIVLLQHNPYHVSTLLQVSEIAAQERDPATAGDLLARALFSLGRAVHSTFAKNLADGTARLDFRRPENREFWLAAWRYMQNLTMRATWRTVYEWGKLLLALAPTEDPYALWLVLDQYALRARQDTDFLVMYRQRGKDIPGPALPHLPFSAALAEFRAGDARKARQALFSAVGRYPWMAARLMQELQLDPPPAVWGKQARTEREKLHAELYAARAKDVWNTPENVNFLVEVSSAVVEGTGAEVGPDDAPIAQNEARNVLLSDVPALIALLPRSLTEQLTSSSDPLPPHDSLASYTVEAGNSEPQADPRGGMHEQTLARLPELSRSAQTIQSRMDARAEAGRLTPEAAQAQERDRQELAGIESVLRPIYSRLRNFFSSGGAAAGAGGEDIEGVLRAMGHDVEVLHGDESEEEEEEERDPNDRRARVEDARDDE